ncbi:MAG TPA: hypothetical protein VFO84_00610 [Dehalococcoidia bacterium]|nr:hypothetical protein [Dehalococcoidia bacterium]
MIAGGDIAFTADGSDVLARQDMFRAIEALATGARSAVSVFAAGQPTEPDPVLSVDRFQVLPVTIQVTDL